MHFDSKDKCVNDDDEKDGYPKKQAFLSWNKCYCSFNKKLPIIAVTEEEEANGPFSTSTAHTDAVDFKSKIKANSCIQL